MITLPPDVVEALRKGNKIEAIKRLRATTKVGLAEAKALVEQLERAAGASSSTQHRPAHHAPHHNPPIPHRPGGLSPGEVPRSSSSGAAILILVVLGAFFLWWWKG